MKRKKKSDLKNLSITPRTWAVLFTVLMTLLFINSLPLSGATINVTTTTDHVSGSLREAITMANNNNEDDTIYLPKGTYVLNGEPDEDANLGGDLDINTTGKITIIGAGQNLTFIDGNQSDRVFHIIKGNIAISRLTVQNGFPQTKGLDCATNTEKDYLEQHGGGIYNASTLTLTDCTITKNHSKNGGWFCRNGGSYGTNGSDGGGIYSYGTLVITNCIISYNTSGARGFNGLTHEGAGAGGGIYNAGTVTITHTTFSFNQTETGSGGAGIYNNGTLTLSNSTISNNTTAPGTGCRHCEYGLPSGNGAGILNEKGNATITNCSIMNNQTGQAGMGDMFLGYSGNGGGIANSGKMTITNTSIYENSTGLGNTTFYSLDYKLGGGGIYNEESGQLNLINCTVSGNATGNGIADMDDMEKGGSGGGILNDKGTLSLINCTIASNHTGQPQTGSDRGGKGGGIYNETGGVCTLTNTILADNSVSPNQEGPDGWGELISNGYNLIEKTTHLTITGNTSTNITGKDPMLSPLINSGGWPYTHVLRMGSPAIDKGYSPTYKTDQLGKSRPYDISTVSNAKDGTDIGAYELSTPYYISGRIKANNTALADVTVEFTSNSGEAIDRTLTDSSGYYLHPIEAGWSGDITPHKKDFTFTPQYKVLLPVTTSVSSQDFTAIPYNTTLTITNPKNNATVGGKVTIAAILNSTPNTAPDQANTRIDFFINDMQVAVDNSAPYEYQWDTTFLVEGSYFIKAIARNSTGDIDEKLITVNVSQGNRIVLSRSEIVMNYYIGSRSVPQQTFTISNSGSGRLEWQLEADSNWFYCSDNEGVNAQSINVHLDLNHNYSPGSYTGAITITAPNAINSPQTIPVRLNVFNGLSQNPFGLFETPADHSTVSSSVPLTGWALDDVGITAVKIYRAPTASEGSSLIYIGEANLVEGARPDIQATYTDYPNNHKAGWGYMLLTNFLPNSGNGTFTFYAVAIDYEGNETTLGSKAITCDNLNAVKPFGAIDTPTQGGTVLSRSGNYINYGWALTPLPNMIPTDGSTITVWIDGVVVGHPIYNKYREDIASLFPGYANSNGAVGYFPINTTSLQDGVHSIAWSVTDNNGHTDGIGSRYFTIYSGYDQSSSASTAVFSSGTLNSVAYAETQPIKWSTGFTTNTTTIRQTTPNLKGQTHLHSKETEPLNIHFGIDFSPKQGYLVVGEQLLPLPIGSTLNQKTGCFHWLPGPGFIGEYELLFTGTTANGELRKKEIHITIKPKF